MAAFGRRRGRGGGGVWSGHDLAVRDNGKGFGLPRAMGDLARDGRLGPAGMEERARLLGGELKIDSEPGKGTAVIIEAPC